MGQKKKKATKPRAPRKKREPQEDRIEVGERRMVRAAKFDAQYVIVGLRRAVNVELAKRGERHRDAAKRAEVTPTWWSRILNNSQMTEQELELIARGIGRTVASLKKEVCR
jgi:hypothetical protein